MGRFDTRSESSSLVSWLVAPFFGLFGLLWIVGKVSEIVGKVLAFVALWLKWPREAMDRFLSDTDSPPPSPPLSPPPKRIGDGGGPDADGAKRPDVS